MSAKLAAPEARRLYRDFWRLYRRWPAEETRAKSFREHWMSRVKDGFDAAKNIKDPKQVDEMLSKARMELDKLTAILDGKIGQEIPLSPEGPIMSSLPNPERYKLLDVGVNEQIRKEKGQMRFLIQEFQRGWRS